MRPKDIELLKQIGELQTIAVKMVQDNLRVSQEKFDLCLIKHVNFNVKNPEECTTEGAKSAHKRNFSPKYHTQMANALQGVIQELEDYRGKIIKDKEQEQMLFDKICDTLDKASSGVQFITTIDEYFIPVNFESPEIVKDLDPRFVYALNKSFGAFQTLNENDIYFVCIHQRKDLRAKVYLSLNKQMDLLPLQIGANYASETTAKWMKARKEFLFNQKKEKISISDEWRIFIERKFDKLKSFAAVNDAKQKGAKEIYKKLIIILFLKVIWPKTGNTNTNFGPEDIDALLIFKNCLSAESQSNLLNEFNAVFE